MTAVYCKMKGLQELLKNLPFLDKRPKITLVDSEGQVLPTTTLAQGALFSLLLLLFPVTYLAVYQRCVTHCV